MFALMDRTLITTVKGYFGVAGSFAEQRDSIAMLFGCSCPVILRKNADAETYSFFIEAYVHGVMEGEAIVWLENREYILEDISIT